MKQTRLRYLDYLKVLATVLVIAHHTAQGFMKSSTWFYHSKTSGEFFLSFSAVNASFFMGLFFMISGYFTVGALARKGTRGFIGGRAKRLLIPVLLLLFLLAPVYHYFSACFAQRRTLNFFYYYIRTYLSDPSYDHGWYLVSLFLYSVVFCLVVAVARRLGRDLLSPPQSRTSLTLTRVLTIFLVMAVLGFATRMVYPIDKWVDLFYVIGIEPAHLPQYVTLFGVGVAAYRNGWFDRISDGLGRAMTAVAAGMIAVIYARVVLPQGLVNAVFDYYAFYESAMCIAIIVALVYWFRRALNRDNRFFICLSENAFGAYIIHNLFVVSFQILFDGVLPNIYWHWGVASLCAVACAFGGAYLLRKIPVVRRIL